LTDPPRVPSGVTAIYAYYIGLAVHGSDGWKPVTAAGEIELMGTVDIAQTLASASVPTGSYDAIRFQVTSALVTFDGANYTATVQGGQLTVRIVGDASVSSSQPAAAIIDIQPTVINVGSESSPQFVLWAEARAFPVPSPEVSTNIQSQGHRFSLTGFGWWDSDLAAASSSLRLSGVSLTSSSLSLTVASSGSSDTSLKMIVISGANLSLGMSGPEAVPSAETGSAVFIVLDNGTLVQFRPLLGISTPMGSGVDQESVFDDLMMAGYNLTGGSSVHLSYSGPIELSFGLMTPPHGISSGTDYWVTVIGDNAIVSAEVTAA